MFTIFTGQMDIGCISKHGNKYRLIIGKKNRRIYSYDEKWKAEDSKYFENKNLPVVNLHGREGHILDYVVTLQRAKEIHVYEGSFMNLADSLTDGSVPLYGHLYCKPHYFDPEMIHYGITENIRQNKWHKNNWNYIWKK
jgi:hypothetical protein